MIPATTATGVARSRNSSGMIPTALSGPRTSPESARMIFQDRVRSRKLVKNGAMTRKSMRFFQRPARKAIV